MKKAAVDKYKTVTEYVTPQQYNDMNPMIPGRKKGTMVKRNPENRMWAHWQIESGKVKTKTIAGKLFIIIKKKVLRKKKK